VHTPGRLYKKHTLRPPDEVFEAIKAEQIPPNYSLRMTQLTAAVIRPQIKTLEARVGIYDRRYKVVEVKLNRINHIVVPKQLPQVRRRCSTAGFAVGCCRACCTRLRSCWGLLEQSLLCSLQGLWRWEKYLLLGVASHSRPCHGGCWTLAHRTDTYRRAAASLTGAHTPTQTDPPVEDFLAERSSKFTCSAPHRTQANPLPRALSVLHPLAWFVGTKVRPVCDTIQFNLMDMDADQIQVSELTDQSKPCRCLSNPSRRHFNASRGVGGHCISGVPR
jgi:hypothetical protein